MNPIIAGDRMIADLQTRAIARMFRCVRKIVTRLTTMNTRPTGKA
jgi:hypothetical protein